jgi:F-type H+-transporting ATPase subunit gamma
MPSHRHIRKRITAVRNTQQITKAMKMVSAAKFRRAQESVLQARPFAREMRSSLVRLAGIREDMSAHPLMARREPVEREDLFVLTSDRGLCGSFNSNVLRAVEHYLLDCAERRKGIFVSTIGRKAYRHFSKQKVPIRQNVEGLLNRPLYSRVVEMAEDLAERFLNKDVDRVTVVFNEFRSAVQQRVVFRTLLPLEKPAGEGEQREMIDYLYEPDKEQLLERIVRRYLANQLFEIVLESVASEHGARMSAMENATDNASDMIGQLTMVYNKARQASITKELMEIVSGAEALKG